MKTETHYDLGRCELEVRIEADTPAEEAIIEAIRQGKIAPVLIDRCHIGMHKHFVKFGLPIGKLYGVEFHEGGERDRDLQTNVIHVYGECHLPLPEVSAERRLVVIQHPKPGT